jgi:hypothetical protein
MKLPDLSGRGMNPIVLATCIFLITLLCLLIEKIVEVLHWAKVDAERTWTLSTSALLLFAVFVSIMLLRTEKNIQSYWNQSMVAFMGLALANALLTTAMSGKGMGEAGSFKFLYLVVTIGFLVFISIVNIARKVVDFAEREEWNQPRTKNRKGR